MSKYLAEKSGKRSSSSTVKVLIKRWPTFAAWFTWEMALCLWISAPTKASFYLWYFVYWLADKAIDRVVYLPGVADLAMATGEREARRALAA